jgi:hypothetical protein
MSAAPGGRDHAMRGRACEVRMGGGDPRRLLVDRGGVLLRRFFRVLGRGWKRWRSRARKNFSAAKGGGGLGAVMGALAPRGGRSRMLSVEERLTLGPKQHMYLVRCGEERLLVASAVEGSLEWMTLPGEKLPRTEESCENTHIAELRAGNGARRPKPRPVSARSRRSAPRAAGMRGRR